MVESKELRGSATVFSEPTQRTTTVYYMAKDPRDNALEPYRIRWVMIALAFVALLASFGAYELLPLDYFRKESSPSARGAGDSGGEHLRMDRGKYEAWPHVATAFAVQLGVKSVVLAGLLGWLLGRRPG